MVDTNPSRLRESWTCNCGGQKTGWCIREGLNSWEFLTRNTVSYLKHLTSRCSHNSLTAAVAGLHTAWHCNSLKTSPTSKMLTIHLPHQSGKKSLVAALQWHSNLYSQLLSHNDRCTPPCECVCPFGSRST